MIDQMIDQRIMDTLKQKIGKYVEVEYITCGGQRVACGILNIVGDFTYIEVNENGYPFVGYGCAIQRITGGGGEVLYDNPLIPDDYNKREKKEIKETRELIFRYPRNKKKRDANGNRKKKK